ncbi:helix-turn-helix domain-containing protein [Candidatus Falkowbacteria bacterium]|nr:helix-turn-helix domain-containing protein [Candidatus Falkowbacteria bacterium]
MKEETLGQVFKRYREEARLRIEQVEKDIKISQRMLQAIENDKYDILPEDLYVRNIIKTYADYLSLDYNKLLNLYQENRGEITGNVIKEQKKTRVYITPQIFRYIVIGLVILALAIYLGFQINNIFIAPKLEVYQPDKNITILQNFIEVKGFTEKEARVFINDKEIYIGSKGEFKATLDLQKGLNTIKISASKKHSKENIIYREVLVQ